MQLHRAFQPKAYGGLELSLPEVADCVAALTYTDYDVCKQILGRSLMGIDPDPTMV